MMCDGLFQLGMGPVVLDATQTEDHSGTRPLRARDVNFRTRDHRAGVLTRVTMPPFTRRRKRYGTQVLMTSA